jgi:hypothetical protein
MKYYMLSKTIKVLPRLKWLNVFMPATVKDWFAASEKSFVPVVTSSAYSDKQRHPAESRILRTNDTTPKP